MVTMTPETAEAILIAEKHLGDAPFERREALAKDIILAIIHHASDIASDAIATAFAEAGKKKQ